MSKMRRSLAVVALIAALSVPCVPLFQGMAAGALANVASSLHVSSVSAPFGAGKATKSVALKIYPPCPTGGSMDC